MFEKRSERRLKLSSIIDLTTLFLKNSIFIKDIKIWNKIAFIKDSIQYKYIFIYIYIHIHI